MPKLLDRTVKKIARRSKGNAKVNPWAVATSALQKAGYLKKGTRKLTAKGRRKSKAK